MTDLGLKYVLVGLVVFADVVAGSIVVSKWKLPLAPTLHGSKL